jgi:hypothetical protein
VTAASLAALGLVAAALALQAAPAPAPAPPQAVRPTTTTTTPAVAPPSPVVSPTPGEIDATIARGLAFLASAQRSSGGFGGPENGCFNDFWPNPEVHRAWSVGSTGLVVMLLVEVERTQELDATLERALHFLVANDDLKKPEEWDLDTIWGHIYGLQGLARALAHADVGDAELRASMRRATQHHLQRLVDQRTPIGGWGYYTMDGWPDPEWTVSFTTAAALLALLDAKSAGFEVAPDVVTKAAAVVARCRLPDGAYDYSLSPLPSTSHRRYVESLNTQKGSIGRSQCCNLALARCDARVSARELAAGLDDFFRYQRFLEIARQRPIPHEAYYQVASYFYFFGQFYASEVLAQLPPDAAKPYAQRLAAQVIPKQEADGAMWDHYMHDHGKPYGTAYGLLALLRCRKLLATP